MNFYTIQLLYTVGYLDSALGILIERYMPIIKYEIQFGLGRDLKSPYGVARKKLANKIKRRIIMHKNYFYNLRIRS